MRAARTALSQKAVRLIRRPSSSACRAVSKLYRIVSWCIVRSVACSSSLACPSMTVLSLSGTSSLMPLFFHAPALRISTAIEVR